ncbi:c-type cytochrome [Zunongwangia sp. F363]|uniref:C-type cytochrome n=1 Tax=Autumnicola tepida TaxID=3075595 RepID=A0ABU3C4Y6_9FLAO|nr:c-type cytochrome [Zunongwangia sp. F363]MDT0641404.1 c-type cytochrome [Zunongwangia sp. F363]
MATPSTGLSPYCGRSFSQAWNNWLRFCLIASILISFSCKDKYYEDVPDKASMTVKDSIKRGEYLVNAIGCHDCHSPKRMGEQGPEIIPELALSGYQAGQKLPKHHPEAVAEGWVLMNADLTAAIGPWGISYASNITPHETGIGTWKKEQFIAAIREGKHKGMPEGRPLLPPMPWQNFAKLSDKDLAAIFVYLKNTQPVNNAVPPPSSPSKIASVQ